MVRTDYDPTFSSLTGTYPNQRIAEGFVLASMSGDPVIDDNEGHGSNSSITLASTYTRAERLVGVLRKTSPSRLDALANTWAIPI